MTELPLYATQVNLKDIVWGQNQVSTHCIIQLYKVQVQAKLIYSKKIK